MRFGRKGLPILTALATVGCVGWSAFRCPEVANRGIEVDAAALESLHKVRVVVRSGRTRTSRNTLATCLRKTDIFGEVVEAQADWNVQLAATIVEGAPSFEPLPILSAMTLGVLPQWATCREGFLIRVSSIPKAPQMIEFDCRFDTTLVYGWPSMLLTPFAAFSTCMWWDPEESQEFADFVKAKMLQNARGLLHLADVEGSDAK